MTFLQNNYEREAASSQYLKLQPNESATIRIISNAVEGLQTFMDNKPIRWKFDGEMPKKAYKSEDKVRPFAAFNVWHVEDAKFKIYSCTTRSILQELSNLSEVEGDPMTYDLKITRKGAGLDTKYYVRVDSKEPFDLDLLELAQKFNDKVDLEQLFVEGVILLTSKAMNIQEIRLSFSSLKQFSRSPAHWVMYKKREFKQSAAMRRGWLTHLLTLEPEKQIGLQIIDCQTRATKAYKEAVAEFGEDKVFTRKEYEEALNLAESVMANPLANKLITEATSVEDYLQFSLDGVKFHGYADVVGKDYVADLKITDNEPRKVQRWVLDNLYHMQLALYSHAIFNSKAEIKNYLITCEPNPPFGVIVYEISLEMAQDGFNRAKLEVQMFKDWYRGWNGKDIPKSYDYLEPLNKPMLLELPTWYK